MRKFSKIIFSGILFAVLGTSSFTLEMYKGELSIQKNVALAATTTNSINVPIANLTIKDENVFYIINNSPFPVGFILTSPDDATFNVNNIVQPGKILSVLPARSNTIQIRPYPIIAWAFGTYTVRY